MIITMHQGQDQHDAVMSPSVVDMKNGQNQQRLSDCSPFIGIVSSSSLTKRRRTRVERDSMKAHGQARAEEWSSPVKGT